MESYASASLTVAWELCERGDAQRNLEAKRGSQRNVRKETEPQPCNWKELYSANKLNDSRHFRKEARLANA